VEIVPKREVYLAGALARAGEELKQQFWLASRVVFSPIP